MHTTITITYPGGDHETTLSHDIGRGMRRLPTSSQMLNHTLIDWQSLPCYKCFHWHAIVESCLHQHGSIAHYLMQSNFGRQALAFHVSRYSISVGHMSMHHHYSSTVQEMLLMHSNTKYWKNIHAIDVQRHHRFLFSHLLPAKSAASFCIILHHRIRIEEWKVDQKVEEGSVYVGKRGSDNNDKWWVLRGVLTAYCLDSANS